MFGSDIKKLPLIFFAFVSVSLLDVCGLGLIFPYINLIIGVEGNVNNKIHIYTRMVYDNPTPDQEIMLFGMVLLLVFACKTMFTILNNWIIFKFSFNKGAKLRVELLSAYQSLCFSDYLSKNSAEYMNAIYTLSAQFSQMVLPIILRFLSDGFLVFVLLIFLGLIDVYALSAMLVLIVMFLFCYDQFWFYYYFFF